MTFYYFLWFLLPFWYLYIIVLAYIRRMGKSHALDDEPYLLRQFIFCVVCFILAIYIDVAFGDMLITDNPLSELGDVSVLRWLIFPAIILIAGGFSRFLPKDEIKGPPAPPRQRY